MVEVAQIEVECAMLSFTKDRRPCIAREKELKEILQPKVVCAIYMRKNGSPHLYGHGSRATQPSGCGLSVIKPKCRHGLLGGC